jgi:hypothetical protein
MRQIYQPILWNGCILCLGRSSNTDRQATLRRPFIETELTGLYILDSSHRLLSPIRVSYYPTCGFGG